MNQIFERSVFYAKAEWSDNGYDLKQSLPQRFGLDD